MKHTRLIPLLLLAAALPANAQDDFAAQARERFESFRNKAVDDFEAFRRKINEDYAKFLEQAWSPKERETTPPPPPEPAPIPPVQFDPEKEPVTPEPKPIEIKRIVRPVTPSPTPVPVAPFADEPNPNLELIPIRGTRPVKPKTTVDPKLLPVKPTTPHKDLDGKIAPHPVKPQPPTAAVSYYGTPLNVSWDRKNAFRLSGVNEKSVADLWNTLSDGRAEGLLRDCLELRARLDLNDWAYLQLLDGVSSAIAGKDTNEATLLMAWLYCQSGYKMRLAMSDSRVYMLFASDHTIYSFSYFPMAGETYYAYNCKDHSLRVSNAEFPQEKPMSLIFTAEPRLASSLSDRRVMRSRRYGVEAVSQTNQNLLKLYDTYPTSYLGGDIMTRWAMYANVPASDEMQEFLYPALRKAVEGLDKREAAERLLNWVQTSLTYEYDEKVWGEDRAFFADESLYYPYADCEDRSILFSRLVRDLLGLDVVLVYYPGHLATAVAFDEAEPRGDYLELNGRRFTVCDPTYINAGTGRTMPGMDNNQAQVILLKNNG